MKCPFCGNRYNTDLPAAGSSVPIYQCGSCRLRFIEHRPFQVKKDPPETADVTPIGSIIKREIVT